MKVFDPEKHDFRPEDKEAFKKEQTPEDAKSTSECLDEALKETFPASDAPAITVPKDNRSQPEEGESKKD